LSSWRLTSYRNAYSKQLTKQTHQMRTLGMYQESGECAEGMGAPGLSATATAYHWQPFPEGQNPSQHTLNQQYIHLVGAKYCRDTRHRSQHKATAQQHSLVNSFAEVQPTLACLCVWLGSTLRVHSRLPCPFFSPPGNISEQKPRRRRRLPKMLSFSTVS